jgi:hypothetical protein
MHRFALALSGAAVAMSGAVHAQGRPLCAGPNGTVPCPSFLEEQWSAYAGQLDQWAREDAADAADDDANRASDYWGAVAANLRTGEIHHVESVYRPTDALGAMREACGGDKDCDLLALYRNTCLALARGGEGEMFWADDAKPKHAMPKALAACKGGGAQQCQALERERYCSGYDYVDAVSGEAGTGQRSLRSKLQAFKNKGGLVGALSPKLAGKSDVQPPQAIYNPMTAQYLSQARPLRGTQAAAVEKPDGKTLWIAYASGRASGARGTGVGLVQGVSAAQAKQTCGQRDCEVLVAARSGECFAVASGDDAQGKPRDFAAKGVGKRAADEAALAQCRGDGARQCAIGISDCVKTLSEM